MADEKKINIDYRDPESLKYFVSDNGKILSSRYTRLSAKDQRKLTKAIKKARRDKNVKAIVFRINSGGGSALASDVILREVKLAKNKIFENLKMSQEKRFLKVKRLFCAQYF